jgi:hypothetical protein
MLVDRVGSFSKALLKVDKRVVVHNLVKQ